jgi:hypothetical protein
MANDTTRKPPGNPAKPRPSTGPTEPGRVAENDRGEMGWEWANDDTLQSDDTLGGIERLRALVDPSLVVVDDDAPNSLKHNAKGLKVGYNPYDSGALGKTERKKKKSLRELSKWIETKHRVAEKKDGDE